MFRELFTALRTADVLTKAFGELSEMLEHAHWMFVEANRVIRREVPPDEVGDSIYRRDKAINDLLRSIRRKIVRHLTINPGVDVAASLALMSVAKDAERIGDYCKNVFEVGRFYKQDFNVPRYHKPLEEIYEEVEDLFARVGGAFERSDNAAAREAIEDCNRITTRCDHIIEQLLLDESSIQTHEAVAYSLLARHFKRVASHLQNICTAVQGRIEELDFKP